MDQTQLIHCMKCRKKVETISPPEKITTKNGKPALTGQCKECGCKVYAFVKMS